MHFCTVKCKQYGCDLHIITSRPFAACKLQNAQPCGALEWIWKERSNNKSFFVCTSMEESIAWFDHAVSSYPQAVQTETNI